MPRQIILVFTFFLFIFFPLGADSGGPSYKKTLKKWTHSDTVYRARDFHAEILLSATWLNDAVLNAQAAKYAQVYDVSDSEQDEFLGQLVKKRDDAVLFFVSFYHYDRHFDDLTDPQAKWDIRLEAGGGATGGGRDFRPLRMEKVNRPTPLERLFYPYLDSWSRGYYVWFPREASNYSSPHTLSVHGPFASSELVWK
ncbi:MAG: hypothetical protein HY541_08580 [Deltaproteobacteria bacterium]|nr:hypothetical protein [Deltaproteobacteria bacterium]